MTPRNAGEPLDLLTNGLHKVADRRGRQDDESCVWAGAPTLTGSASSPRSGSARHGPMRGQTGGGGLRPLHTLVSYEAG